MRSPSGIRGAGFLAALLVAVSAPGAAAQNTHVGARIGYNFDSKEAVLSANLAVPMTSRVDFYPSLDVYTPDRGNKIGFNGDVKIGFPLGTGSRWYAGGGIGIVNRNVGEFANTDVGANLLGGMESTVGWIHPFVEGKVLLHDRTQFQLIGGINLTMGR